ncbi:MAG TPA: hypothetical protein VFD80_08685 [Flavobacteriaceae bacterium]|nr:hypothetical protein [Flavobacteriaceae bacterium]
MKNKTLLFVLILCSASGISQNFSKIVSEIASNLQTVENNKNEVSQSIQEVQPGVIQISQISTVIKSGNTTNVVYEFNMADIDVNTIRAYTNKDVIQVQLLVGKKQKLIKTTTDNQKIAYTDGFDILAKNIDNGRILSDLFQSLVPLAIEITEKRLSLNSFQQHLDWLEQNVTNVALLDRQYNQVLKINEKYPGRVEFKVDENTSKKNTSESYHFNLANINPNSIVFEIKGDVSIVNLETRRKLNTIKTFSEGVQGNYTNSFVIYCESVEKARDLQKVLKEAIIHSEKAIENSIPTITNINNGIQTLNNYIGNVVINETTYTQSLNGECVIEIEKNTTSGSKATHEKMFLNLKDINSNTIKYNTKGKNVFVDFQTTGGNKFIKHIVDGVQKNYTNSFSLEFSEIEEAIMAEAIFKSIIKICENQKVDYSLSKDKLIERLKNEIRTFQDDKLTYNQTIEVKDNNLQIKITEISDKKSVEKIYELNMRDLNPSGITFQTSSKSVYVTLQTNYLEKIIKYYEDGAIKNYQNSIEIQAENVENARVIVDLFKNILSK